MHSFVSLFVCCLALLSVAAGAKTVKPVCKAPVPPQPGSLRIAVLEVSVAEGNKLVNSREYKKSGANNNFVDDKESMANAQHLAENRRQYCALHGCDCLTTPSSYPLLAGEQGRQKNPSLTEFPFVRAALPFYDWVYRKQADTVFVNFGISIESLVAAFPADAHFGYPITSSDGGTDSAWLVRNSPRGNQMIQEMTDLQCPAPGMGMIHTYVLHLLNGSSVNGSAVFYNGDCEEMCAKADIPIFDYKAYWACLSRHFLAFGIEDRWQREQVVIPGGFWAQPASYATALANGRTPIGDDIGRYSPSGAWVYKTADGLLQKADFKARFKTTLALHMGGGLKGSGAALAVKVRNELFPWCPLRGSSWLVSDAFGSGEKPLTDWKFRVDRLS